MLSAIIDIVKPKERDPRFKLTIDDEQTATIMYVAGMRIRDVAKEFGTSDWVIRRIVKAANVQRDERKEYRIFSPEELVDIDARWRNGESQNKIAIAYKTHQVIISRVLREHGLAPEKRLNRREKSNFWNGGRIQMDGGYWQVLVENDDPFAKMRNRTGYILEHRLVMARSLGRPLLSSESVHHINGDRSDNRLENLQLRVGNHGNGIVYKCADCGSLHIVPTELEDN